MTWLSTVSSASSENWRRSIRQVSSIAFISLIPLLCKATYYYFEFSNTPDQITYFEALVRYIVSGDLLFFSITNFAAVLWIVSQDFQERFDERIYFIILSVIGLSICTFFVGINPTFAGIPRGIVQTLSILTFLTSLVANTFLLVFETYSGVDYSSSVSKGEDDTSARLAKRRAK